MESRLMLTDIDDPTRNDVVTEHSVRSLCRSISTASRILNPSNGANSATNLVAESKPATWHLSNLKRAIAKTLQSAADYMAQGRRKHALTQQGAYQIERYPHSQTLADIKTSADHGCHLYSYYIAHLGAENGHTLRQHPELTSQQQFHLYITRRGWKGRNDIVEMLVSPFLSAVDESAVQLDRSTHCVRHTLALAKFWLRSYTSSHSLCSPISQSPLLPTRLVDLSAPKPARVVDTAILNPESTPYLTLRHCWGGASVLSLTVSTASALQAGIPLCNLPRGFRNAAHVTTSLGYRYL
ncbi:hypothetical protein B0H63DRAFT_537363 [Podospora didyma]|uniref:Uncharacterized protein n=1 Tax=Podospora didyma TaxID=330526 RepID=A0AAE0NXG1_9PEZI|nr:hypothetical protein B0H63DRAFT_537363 [Podospora didyma]